MVEEGFSDLDITHIAMKVALDLGFSYLPRLEDTKLLAGLLDALDFCFDNNVNIEFSKTGTVRAWVDAGFFHYTGSGHDNVTDAVNSLKICLQKWEEEGHSRGREKRR